MKKTLVVLAFASLCSFECSKNSDIDTTHSIDLYDKPLPIIQAYIQGKWKLHYTTGGLCGTCKFNREMYNEYYQFLPDNMVIYSFKDSIVADTKLTWFTYKPANLSYSINVMEFYDKRQSPNYFQAGKIYNDTLVLYSPDMATADALSFYLTKLN